jgi:long-chain acyl-CoA synthetase
MGDKVYMDEKAQNLNQALLAAMDTYAGRTCFRVKRGRRYYDVSYRRFQKLAFRLVNFFNHYGLDQGERVAIIADNSMEWMVAYVACLLSGGVAVPLPTSLSPDILQYVLRDSSARLAVVQDERQSHILESMLEELPELDTVLAMNKEQGSLLGAFPMAEVLTKEVPPDESEVIRGRAQSVEPQTLATLYYTSGQTDRPRGAVFDHAQRLLAIQYMAEWFTLGEDDLVFSMHPWGYARSLDVAVHCFLSGVANFAESPNESYESVIEDMLQTGPTIALVTPAHFEIFYNSALQEISELPEASRQLFHWALAKGKEYRAAGTAASPELREQYDRAFMTFFSQIKGRVGGRLRRIYSVGAQVSEQLLDFSEVIGMLMLNIYHVTEAGGFPAVSLPDAYRAGSCGQVAPGFQVRIADDGEVLIRGETVMRQYWRQPEETGQVIAADGWLHTGDLGHFDRDGYLYLTGRKQSLIVLSTSQRVIPISLEEALTASPFIFQAAVFGDGRLYVSALIVPDLEAVTAHYRDRGDNDKPSPAKVKALLDRVIREVNSQLRPWEQIRAYRVLDEPLNQVSGELEASTEINRQALAERYAPLIEAMYPTIIQPGDQIITQVEIEPEQLRKLLEKQEVLDVWIEDAGIGFLFDLARDKGIDVPSMVHICETVVAIAYMQNEEKPLSTALIVGDPADIAHVLPGSEIQLNRYDHIRRMRQVMISLSRLVDGTVLGYGVDKHGYIRGIHKLGVELDEAGSFLLGHQARHHAAISRECKALVFFVPPGGRQVRVFADGQLVGRYANGSWSPESIPRIDAAVAHLAEQKKYDLALLQRVLRCAFQMSEQNLGAIFVLGNADSILERSDPPEISSFATIADADMQQLSEGELVNFAKQDGATVIDTQGRLRGCMVLLRPAADTQAEIGVGKGARHSSAAKISAEEQCLAITVSQDGPITVYDCGQRVLSL